MTSYFLFNLFLQLGLYFVWLFHHYFLGGFPKYRHNRMFPLVNAVLLGALAVAYYYSYTNNDSQRQIVIWYYRMAGIIAGIGSVIYLLSFIFHKKKLTGDEV